jgi:uncharacterized membrane protein (UPF0127 family)
MRRLVVIGVLVSACSNPAFTTAGPATTASSPSIASSTSAAATTQTTAATTTAVAFDTGDVNGFVIATIQLDGTGWDVAIADDSALRARGLMQVEDLGALDGMLFVWPAEIQARFTMHNTLIPLDIAFFDANGDLLEVLQMVPCDESPCPGYGIDSPFRWALEAPSGSLTDLPSRAKLET